MFVIFWCESALIELKKKLKRIVELAVNEWSVVIIDNAVLIQTGHFQVKKLKKPKAKKEYQFLNA